MWYITKNVIVVINEKMEEQAKRQKLITEKKKKTEGRNDTINFKTHFCSVKCKIFFWDICY